MSSSSALTLNGSLPSLLVVIIDIESLLSGLKVQHGQDHSLDMNSFVTFLSTFASTYGLMNRNNKLSILTFSSYGVDYILPSKESMSQANHVVDFAIRLHAIHGQIHDSMCSIVNDFLEKEQTTPEVTKISKRERSLLSSALSTAVTLIHRQKQMCNLESRVLVMHFDKEVPHNYNAVMNCIFSAKKMDTLIDALVFSNFAEGSPLLQQASYLTGGLYKTHKDWRDMQLLLQSFFVTDKSTRSLLLLPTQEKVDFRASCYCHQQPRDFAHMCSVCLTLVCEEPNEKCCVCQIPIRQKSLRK